MLLEKRSNCETFSKPKTAFSFFAQKSNWPLPSLPDDVSDEQKIYNEISYNNKKFSYE